MINFNLTLLSVSSFSIVHPSGCSRSSSDFSELIVVVLSMNIFDDVLETTCDLSFHPSNVIVADVSVDVDCGLVASADVVSQLFLSVVYIYEVVVLHVTQDTLIPGVVRVGPVPYLDHHLPRLCPSFERCHWLNLPVTIGPTLRRCVPG